jgi:hypothetical protein
MAILWMAATDDRAVSAGEVVAQASKGFVTLAHKSKRNIVVRMLSQHPPVSKPVPGPIEKGVGQPCPPSSPKSVAQRLLAETFVRVGLASYAMRESIILRCHRILDVMPDNFAEVHTIILPSTFPGER